MGKNIFLFGAVALVALGLFFHWGEDMNNKDMKLRVAFPYDKSANEYEPTKIHLGPEYIFLENIFSPLIELNKKTGVPTEGVAESFEWVGDELHLKIRDDLRTIDGTLITVDDAIFSLKRVLILSSNTHGNFKDLVCPNQNLKNITDECDGISSSGNTLILKSAGGKKPFLLPMLAAIDFAIIPRSSVRESDLRIIDYKNTSGVYYVENDSNDGRITLGVNKKHYNYAEDIPQSIELVPSGIKDYKSSLDLFKNKKVDFITTVDVLNSEKIIDLAKETDSSLHTTLNIRRFVLTFTEKGVRKFTPTERIAIGKTVKKVFQDHFKNASGYEMADHFIPSFGDGGLGDNEAEEIKNLYSSIEASSDGSDIKISVIRSGKLEEYKHKLEDALKGAEVYEGDNAPAFKVYKNNEDMPDMFISGPDTGYNEDIALITYSAYAGFFGPNMKEVKEWVKKYMRMSDKSSRLAMLKRKHMEMLKDGILIPLVSSTYAALGSAEWNVELSQLHANNQLWYLKRK